MIGDSGFHGGGHAKRAVDWHEIVVGEIQGERRVVILPLFAESVRPSRHFSDTTQRRVEEFAVLGTSRCGTAIRHLCAAPLNYQPPAATARSWFKPYDFGG